MEMRGVGAGQGKASQQPDRSLIHPSILFRPVVLERRCRTKECIILIANVLGELDTSGLLCVAQDGVVSCFVETRVTSCRLVDTEEESWEDSKQPNRSLVPHFLPDVVICRVFKNRHVGGHDISHDIGQEGKCLLR